MNAWDRFVWNMMENPLLCVVLFVLMIGLLVWLEIIDSKWG